MALKPPKSETQKKDRADEVLSKVAEFYEDEVENAVDTLSTLLEPLIMVVLGTLVGGIVVALYLPIFKLAGTF